MDDRHFSYITKLKINNGKERERERNATRGFEGRSTPTPAIVDCQVIGCPSRMGFGAKVIGLGG